MLDGVLPFAGPYGDRGYFVRQQPTFGGRFCPLQAGNGVAVHGLPGQAVGVSGVLGKTAHGAAGVGVLQTVDKHVIKGLSVAQSNALAARQQQLRGIAHAFQSAADYDLVGAGCDTVHPVNGGLHTAATGFVDGDRAGAAGYPGTNHRLPGRALLESRRENTAHEDLVDRPGVDAGLLQCRVHCRGAKFDRADVGQVAQQAAHGRPGTTDQIDCFSHLESSPVRVGGRI